MKEEIRKLHDQRNALIEQANKIYAVIQAYQEVCDHTNLD